jgi:hypothetical protein
MTKIIDCMPPQCKMSVNVPPSFAPAQCSVGYINTAQKHNDSVLRPWQKPKLNHIGLIHTQVREEDLQRCILGRYRNQSINIKKLENQMRNLKTLNNTKTNRGIPRRTNPICLDCKPLSLIRLIQKIITILVWQCWK